jgi:NAD kinase
MRAAIVYKISIWEIYSESPDEETRSYLESGGRNLETLKRSASIQKETLRRTREALDRAGIRHDLFYRAELTSDMIADRDIVVSVGGDGTFLEASHTVPSEIPMLGVNSDPERSTGFFSATDGAGIDEFIRNLAAHERTTIDRLQASIDGAPAGPPVLNDVLFAHPNPAATTRYRMIAPDPMPEAVRATRNSGFLVCTAAGSSGWMFQEHGELMNLDDHRMQYLHRGMRSSSPTLTDAETIELESLTRRGTVFIDGERTQIPLTLGQRLTVQPGVPLTVIGDLNAKRPLPKT